MSEGSNTPSASDAGLSKSEALRVSQRQPLSCTECTRRKTRCDRVLPCSNCRKRGIPERCRVQQIIPSKSLHTVNAVQSLRQETITAQSRLEDRIAQLERLVQSAVGTVADSQSIASPSVAPQQTQLEQRRGSVKTDGGRSNAGGQDEESVAAATLEFLALGRVRAKSPGGKDEDQFEDQEEEDSWEQAGDGGMEDGNIEVDFSWMTEDGQPSPSHRSVHSSVTPHAASPRPMPTSRPSVFAGYKAMIRSDILSRLPSTSVGRALVRYDIENVSWLHCCYHAPTFLSESELFWSELGSDDVEVNWSFLALLFGVLMSALYHMPSSVVERILPGHNRRQLVESWFDCCLLSLNEANWMSSHSLYSVQCIAIIISPQIIWAAPICTTRCLGLLSELHKLSTTWAQLIIQDWFHLGFNNTCSIQASQFDTPPPLHCLDQTHGVTKVRSELPTVPAHTYHLLKLASLVNEVYSHASSSGDVPYDIILRTDEQVQEILAAAPAWMRSVEIPLEASWPLWVEWQRRVFMVSAAHKVIVLHRPYLGRAFRGDVQYAKSREACLAQARFITDTFCRCALETFRRTWTVLAHTLAACIVLLLEASHQENEGRQIYDQLTVPVKSALSIFVELAEVSDIAKKASAVLTSLLEQGPPGRQNATRRAAGPKGLGTFDRELDRAARLFRRTSSSASTAERPSTSTSPTASHAAQSHIAESASVSDDQVEHGMAWADFVLNTRGLEGAITGIPYELETAVDWSTFAMAEQ
ncbi:hypothetical protein CI109_102703 [Kwoniella shandongensis]|uniref:Zn(2)-C6 fungal-type domain-containing protein n=1 Tax=Kwoniella shandongensis TaxID=1734106 RepID=A0AAJ8LFI8_9TREE